MTQKFKVGDTVVGNKTHFLNFRRGMEGKIVEVFVKAYSVIWKGESMRNFVEEREIDLVGINSTWGELTPEQKGALLLAHQQGKAMEVKASVGKTWVTLAHNPLWLNNTCYRVKPDPVVVNSCKHISIEGVICKLTYNKIDGVLDYSSAKLSKG